MDSKDPRNGVPMGTFKQGGDSDPKSAQKTDPAAADTSPDLFVGRPSRKRVRTLLGVPLADALGGQPPRPEPRNEDISQAIQSVLNEEDIAIPVEIEDIEGEISLVADAELAEYFDPPAAKSAPAVPLLIPSPYAEAQAREQKDSVSDTAKQPVLSVESNRDSESSIDTRKQRVLNPRDEDRDSEAVIATTKRAALAPAAAAATTSPLPAAASDTQSSAASTPPAASLPPPAAISSLMPREVRRPQLAPAESTPRVGLLMVAAMFLIAGGGWWLTSGSFSRTADSAPRLEPAAPQALAQPPAAPQEAMQAQAPAPLAAPEQPVATQAELQKAASTRDFGGHDKAVAGVVRSSKPKGVAGKAKPSAGGDVPEQPSRAVVVQRLEAVRSSVQACAAGRSGVADLDITVANSGAVTHVLVGGDFAGTTQGSCIARAVRTARFPSFKQERLRLLFPYVI